jgi:hypothetical protein
VGSLEEKDEESMSVGASFRLILFLLALLIFAGTVVEVSQPLFHGVLQPSAVQAQDDVEKMTFVRHPSGLCFGVVRFSTAYGYHGTTITYVPDSACGARR